MAQDINSDYWEARKATWVKGVQWRLAIFSRVDVVNKQADMWLCLHRILLGEHSYAREIDGWTPMQMSDYKNNNGIHQITDGKADNIDDLESGVVVC